MDGYVYKGLLYLNGILIMKRILKKKNERVWIGFNWLSLDDLLLVP